MNENNVNTDIDRLETEISRLCSRLEDTRDCLDRERAHSRQSEKTIERLQNKLIGLQQIAGTHDDPDVIVNDLITRLENLRHENQALTTDISSLKKDIADLDATSVNLSTRLEVSDADTIAIINEVARVNAGAMFWPSLNAVKWVVDKLVMVRKLQKEYGSLSLGAGSE